MDFSVRYWAVGLATTAVLSLAFWLGNRRRYQAATGPRFFAGDATYLPLLITYSFVLGLAVSDALYHPPINGLVSGWLFIGLATVVGARLLMVWAYRTIGDNFAPTAHNNDAEQQLIEAGPYRYFKHPIYAGNFLFLVGVLMLVHAYTAWLAMIPYVLALGWRMRVEDRLLEEKFHRDQPDD